ncbi:hypothetical protein BGZ96_004146 [Linnemannia gamsii]|uniref:Uncharacterized protein n=1 Tax=Linnemannia gamsii TaxID=64522 RepID=A0ABQ7K6U8_9FUNG|nr:hypothetical protein BGZ96_004146 [Linnemannia gamsii]
MPIQKFRVYQQKEVFEVESYLHKDTDRHLIELDDMEVILGMSHSSSTETRISAVYFNGEEVHVAVDHRNTPLFPLSIVLRREEILEVTLESPSPVMQQSVQVPSPPITPPRATEQSQCEEPLSPRAQAIVEIFTNKLMSGHHQRQLHRGRLSGRFTPAQIAGVTHDLSHVPWDLQISQIKSIINRRLDQTDIQIHQMNQNIQQNTYHIQQNSQHIQQNGQAYQQGTQDIMRNLDGLQKHMQSIQRQTFELSEFTTPRLFIVLPTKEQGRFVHKFKIYFLCECDDHQGWTHRSDSQVHVANHEGYELERPTEFFRKYGKQIVHVMTFLKYAVLAAGTAIPILAHVGFIEGLDNTSRLIRDISEDLVGKTDFVIDYLATIGENEIAASSDRLQSHVIGQNILSSIEPLSGPELRQLQKFLRAKDGDNIYANLHKTVTSEGYVRWVCAHHRQEADRPASMARLQEFLGRAGGYFDTNTGVLVMFLSTRQDARELYNFIRRLKFIHQLTVSFDWKLQDIDLFELKDAVTASSIRHLELDGERYSGSWDPVLAIMATPKLQVLSVKKFGGFLLNTTLWPNNVQLRFLDFSEQTIADATVQRVIDACPSLATLTMSTTDIKETFEHNRRTAEQHRNLATLTLKQMDPSQASNSDKPSVAYFFNKDQRTILSATLTLRTQFYGNLIQLPMVKKVAYRPIGSTGQHSYEMVKSTALTFVKRFTEMESFEYQCHFNHFKELFTAIKQQHFAIKEEPYQQSLLRRVKLIDEHGSFLVSQNIHDKTATRYSYEEASRLVQDGTPAPRPGIQRDLYGTSRGSVGAQRPQDSLQRAPYGGSVNNGRPVSTPANIPAAYPIYSENLRSYPVLLASPPAMRSQGPVFPQLAPSPLPPDEDGSRMKTMVFNSSLTYSRIKEINDSIRSRGHSALERMVWDITDLNNVWVLRTILAILDSALRSNQSRKPAVEIKVRLVSGMCIPGSGVEGGGGVVTQPGLSSLLDSADMSFLCIFFTTHVTRLELFGRDLDLFLPRLCQSYHWTMSELKELVVDGQSTLLNKKSLEYLQDIVSRGPDVATPDTKTIKPAQPLQQLIIQNVRLFDVMWSQLLISIDWLTLRTISFRGSDFKLGQLVELETAVIRTVERCREKQRVLKMNGLSSRDLAMVQDLIVRQGGDAHLLVSLYQTQVTMSQIEETQERLYKRGIHWCLFTMSDL